MGNDSGWLRELRDRQLIQDTLTRYASALDLHTPDLFAEVFTDDAIIDYTAAEGIKGDWRELRDWLAVTMSRFSGWQHLLSNMVVSIEGDEASARTECYNPLVTAAGEVLHVGCNYTDRLRRVGDDWRIFQRRLSVVWMDGPMPP